MPFSVLNVDNCLLEKLPRKNTVAIEDCCSDDSKTTRFYFLVKKTHLINIIYIRKLAASKKSKSSQKVDYGISALLHRGAINSVLCKNFY